MLLKLCTCLQFSTKLGSLRFSKQTTNRQCTECSVPTPEVLPPNYLSPIHSSLTCHLAQWLHHRHTTATYLPRPGMDIPITFAKMYTHTQTRRKWIIEYQHLPFGFFEGSSDVGLLMFSPRVDILSHCLQVESRKVVGVGVPLLCGGLYLAQMLL